MFFFQFEMVVYADGPIQVCICGDIFGIDFLKVYSF